MSDFWVAPKLAGFIRVCLWIALFAWCVELLGAILGIIVWFLIRCAYVAVREP